MCRDGLMLVLAPALGVETSGRKDPIDEGPAGRRRGLDLDISLDLDMGIGLKPEFGLELGLGRDLGRSKPSANRLSASSLMTFFRVMFSVFR